MSAPTPPSISPGSGFPRRVRVVQTTRAGGVGAPPYDSLNLGLHVGDDPETVRRNRALLRGALPADPLWLRQVHGVRIADADRTAPDGASGGAPIEADGAVTGTPGRVVAVMTADCLPAVIANAAGTRVAVVHAGWRGLAAGIVRAGVAAFDPDEPLHVWLGPAIGPDAFEVGAEVREAFADRDPGHAAAFRETGAPGVFLADLYALARREACAVDRTGAVSVTGGERCTLAEREAFFSHRRDGRRTGRMATLAWLGPAP